MPDESRMTAQELATYGTEYLSRVLEAEHDRFVEAENKTSRYGQVLAVIIGAAVVGGVELRNVLTSSLTWWGVLFVMGSIGAAAAAMVGIHAITAVVRVEDTPGMPADGGTINAFADDTQSLAVVRDINARYGDAITALRQVNERRYRYVNRAFWATYITLICALVAVVGYAGVDHGKPRQTCLAASHTSGAVGPDNHRREGPDNS